jgi:hypothetical protein
MTENCLPVCTLPPGRTSNLVSEARLRGACGCQAGCELSWNSPRPADSCGVFIWGSFVTAKSAPKDLDLLLILSPDFDVDRMPAPAQAVFDSTRAKLLFEADVFWARASIGQEMLDLWLDTYQTSRSFRKRGIVELVLP